MELQLIADIFAVGKLQLNWIAMQSINRKRSMIHMHQLSINLEPLVLLPN